MFVFFKKSFIESELLNGFTDIHCHVLPGVDDGIQKMENALRVLAFYEEHGVQRVFFTPHIADSLHENTRAHLTERFNELKSKYTGKLELSLGAEYMIDNGFEQLLDQKEDFLCASGNRLLVETTTLQAPMNFDQILFEVQDRGYEIILAHPERYLYMHSSDYESLANRGIKFQLNLLSIAGLYGGHAMKKSKKLLERGMYSFVGTDLHSLKRHREEFGRKAFSKSELSAIAKLIQNNANLPIGK